MPNIEIHSRENNAVSEMFLKENGKKFSNQCNQVLRLLYKGMRLTAKQANDILGIADSGRRLRDIHANRKECKKQIRRTADGKLEGMEYFLDVPMPPTKDELQQWFREYQEGKHDNVIPMFHQQNLF